MIILASTSALVEVTTSSTQTINVQASYVDMSGGSTYTPGALNSSITTATTTTVVGSPASSTSRAVKFLSIYNAGSAAETVTVKHTDGTTTITLISLSLTAGYVLSYTDQNGWIVNDASGGRVETPLAGRWQKTTLIQTGTTSFTTGPSTSTIHARLQAAGGSGGGNSATAGAAGGGGAGGGYAEWWVSVTPNTTYTCAVGAGVNGTSAAAGSTGGNTTLTIGSTTCTANGGPGGAEGTSATASAAGGASPAVSTNGTINCGGEAGGNGSSITAADGGGAGGQGGASQFGSGGQGKTATGAGNSAASFGFGGGGGGSYASTATAEAGGASAPGCIVIEEYS